MTLRAATRSDHDWIRDVAAEVYAPFGDYRPIVPVWLRHPGVLAFVDEEAGDKRGFILVGMYEPPQGVDLGVPPPADGPPQPGPPGQVIADLLAIAVAPRFQRQGVGRRLLEAAIDVAQVVGEKLGVQELRLTVSASNLGAQRLFTSAGFTILDAHHGHYDRGQRAIRMTRRVR